MNKKDIEKIRRFQDLADQLEEQGFEIDDLLEEREQIEISDMGEFLDMARRYDAEIYVCSGPHLNFDADGINFYIDAECGVQDYLAAHDIKFKLV